MVWWLVGCGLVKAVVSPPAVPDRVVQRLAPDLVALGHPQGAYLDARVVGWENGAAGAHERYVDAALRYTRPQREAPYTMVVRLYVEGEEPCRASVDVVADDGPPALLLDNGLAAAAFGETLCRALAEAGSRSGPT
ncbi:MAG: hypothetical protein R3F59_08875 [Myxococcota bacterium]